MRKSLRLSAIALLTTALTAFPAYALSLNLGGDGPLVDLGNGNNADATVSVDTGNLLGDGDGGTKANAAVKVNLGDIGGGDSDNDGALGSIIDNDGDGGLVNLGGNHDLIDLGGNGDSVIDLGGDGNLLDLGGLGGSGGLVDLADIDLGDGPLLDLTGGSGDGGLVDVDLGRGDLLDLGETGSILDLGSDGDLLDLGSSGTLLDLGSDGDLLDLGGTSGELVALDLGNTRVNAGLNLEGGDKPLAKVTIGTSKDGVAGTGLLSDTNGSATIGGSNAATVAISSGDDSGDSGGGGGGNGGGSIGGNGIGGDGSPGSGNGGGGSASGNGSGGGSGGGSGIDLFGGGGDACLTLNASQLDQLIDRHAYNPATFSSWANARQLKIVEVDFCDRAVADVAAAAGGSANVARLQAFLAAQAKVRTGLESKGHSAGDVIAADHSGNTLIVYVI